MFSERLAGVFAHAVDEVPYPGRQAGCLGDLDQQPRSQGRKLSRLVDDRAAGRQRRSDLPGRQHEWSVPRRDHAHRADRHARRHVELTVGAQHPAIARFRRAVGVEAEILGAAQSGFGHEFERLPGIHALDESDLLGACDDRVGNFVQEVLCVCCRRAQPMRGMPALRRALAARSMSGALPCAILASGFKSTGDIVSKLVPSHAGTARADLVLHAVLAEAREILFRLGEVCFECRHRLLHIARSTHDLSLLTGQSPHCRKPRWPRAQKLSAPPSRT